jgi:broad specificity phosphatase PhoE
MTARILLIRHAEPARWALGRAIGRTDVGLSREGSRQARALAVELAADRAERLVSSPAARALRTSAPIVRGCNVTVEVDPDLREIDFGEFDGRTFASVEREHQELYAAWMRSPTAVDFPGGESWPVLRARSDRALRRIAEAGDGRTTVVVTHLGVILATLARVLPVADEEAFRIVVRHTQICPIVVEGDTWVARVDGSPESRNVDERGR